MAENTQILFKSRPTGWVDASHFEVAKGPVAEPGPGEVLVRNIFMSLDPYMRGRMRDQKSYTPGFELGQVLQAGAVGEVTASNDPALAVGDLVEGRLGWETYSVAKAASVNKVDGNVASLSHYLGVLGMPSMTAWVGLRNIGQPKAGETVYVSAASGAVGQVAGQIAKLQGCYVAGSAGSDDKAAYIRDDLGFDAAFNYKTASSLSEGLRQVCPNGIDVYFENVGGAMLDAVLLQLNPYARVVACGMISQYNLEKPEGVKNLGTIVGNKVRMQGFIVSDHMDLKAEFMAEMSGWLAAGKIKYREDITQGIENAPAAFIGMLKGKNFGKQVVQIGDPPE
ncbi:MAG: NADP-dependent oxidoreductase [Rhodospirillaceae bacterium]|jgi:NADPH-dependent curcumin reductase CurA|nr:NADP-dependent oxidoreductase [Rhodospirillaceae bacterium]